jgi:putative ABC transport system permease protein
MRRRLLLYMSSIALGVGALVAIDSFATNVNVSVHQSSRALLGGDIAFSGRAPLRASAAALVDSLTRVGARTARVTTFPSMASVSRTRRTRLAQVRAVSDGYPLIGQVATDPAGAWGLLATGDRTIVDPALLATLGARLGDSLTLGYTRFEIVGTIRAVPGDAGISAAIGPRVFIPERDLTATKLLVFGSRADYRTLVAWATPTTAISERWVRGLRPRLDREHVRVQTAADAESNLTSAIQRLTDFLGIIGVVALLLGGIGVASGVAAFVARKIDTAAILRCLGATGPQVLTVYVTQAAVMGLVGATAGAALGIGIQFVLPVAARDFLPVDLAVSVVPRAIGIGLAIGLWVSLLFALRPLLRLRRVSPLQALRRDVDTPSAPRAGRPDMASLGVAGAIAGTIVAVAVSRAPSIRIGLGTAAGVFAAVTVLWAAAAALAGIARRVVRPQWPYVLRQGVANLHRPANQTRAVVVALGCGAFLISTLYLVQSALLHEFSTTTQASRGNLLFFDVQQDQARGVDSVIRQAGFSVIERTPIVTMRLAAIGGVSVATVATDTTDTAASESRSRSAATSTARGSKGRPRRAQWALRREYRSTYRDTLVPSERLVAGRWPATGSRADSLPGVSLEDGVAHELGVGVGEVVTWDVQGVPVRTRVASLRAVDWARFEPNFFAVFANGVLERAPQQFVILANVPSATATATIQRDVVDQYPNVSTIDLSLIRETVNGILNKVAIAIRFLAVFALVMGLPVLVSAVAATRRERVHEGVLLKTLGATRSQVGRIMVAEYALLGVLASVAGIALSFLGAWALVHFVFEAPFVPTIAPAFGIAALTAALTIAIGAAGSRDVFAQTPLAMLRAE